MFISHKFQVLKKYTSYVCLWVCVCSYACHFPFKGLPGRPGLPGADGLPGPPGTVLMLPVSKLELLN